MTDSKGVPFRVGELRRAIPEVGPAIVVSVTSVAPLLCIAPVPMKEVRRGYDDTVYGIDQEAYALHGHGRAVRMRDSKRHGLTAIIESDRYVLSDVVAPEVEIRHWDYN